MRCGSGMQTSLMTARAYQVVGESAQPDAAARIVTRRSAAQILLSVLPFLVIAVVAVADVMAGPRFGFLPLLALGPALAAASLRPAKTALVGGLAVVLCVALAAYDDLLRSQRGIVALAGIAGITAAGAFASAARHRRDRELADVTAVAEAAQRILLRPVPAEIGRIRLATRYVSASASARIGGDLYAVVAARRAVRLIVADVQGKGLSAAQTAAVVLGAFREAAYDAPGLADIVARIEISLERQATEEEFVTAVLAQIADGGSAVEVLNCGHPAPLLVSGGTVRFVDPPAAGLPLGLTRLAVSARKSRTIELAPRQRLLFYTDGISEARDRSGTFYPLDRCAALLSLDDLDAALDRLSDDVVRHVGHRLRDDAAMLLISQRPGPHVVGRVNGTAQAEHRAPERRASARGGVVSRQVPRARS